MKVLLITFSDNADHQDITFGMFESLHKAKRSDCDVYVMREAYNSTTQLGVVIDGYRFERPCIAFNVEAITEQVSEVISGYLIKLRNNVAFRVNLFITYSTTVYPPADYSSNERHKEAA